MRLRMQRVVGLRGTLRRRMILGLVVFTFPILVCTLFLIRQLVALNSATQSFREEATRLDVILEVSQQVTSLILVAQSEATRSVADSFSRQVGAEAQGLRARQRKLVEQVSGLPADDPMRVQAEEVSEALGILIELADDSIRHVQEDNWPEAKLSVGVLWVSYNRLGQDIDRLIAIARDSRTKAESQVSRAMMRTVVVSTPLLLVALVIAVGVVFATVRSVTVGVEQLTRSAMGLAEGRFEERVPETSADELGQLARSFNMMADRLEEHYSEMEERLATERSTVQRYVDHMAELTRGNLAARLSVGPSAGSQNAARLNRSDLGEDEEEGRADDPLVVLGRELNETTAGLQSMTLQIRDAADNLRAAASEILAAATQQASGSSQQSAAIAQTTATVQELKTIAEQSAVQAQEVVEASQRTVDVSRTGRQAVQDTVGSMGQIKARVEGLAENIVALSEQTGQIGEIIATMNDIAAQSNMLALNAAVEAARAGEYGKGFSIVAVEVQNLAEQSRQATAQVKAILSDIQEATNATVLATEEGTKRVDEGMQLAMQAGEAIEQLTGVIEESSQAATQMVAGGRQQSTGVEQVALAMQSINQATMQSLASARQAEKAAQDLNDLARGLAEIVERYQL